MSDHTAFLVEIEGMDDAALDQEATRLRGELADKETVYAQRRDQWAATGVYTPPTEEQLIESHGLRKKLGMVEHCITRRVAKASLASYGSCPADWPEENETNDAE